MKVLLFLLLFLKLSASESFITDYEYGEMLYTNPRGVGCIQCHGKVGEGKIIVTYKDKEKNTHIVKGADIRKTTLKEMIASLNSYHKIMPRYYLTDDEVKYIFDYLKLKNKKRRGKN